MSMLTWIPFMRFKEGIPSPSACCGVSFDSNPYS
jgi:hypothetical protein